MKELLEWLEQTRGIIKEDLTMTSKHGDKAQIRFYEGQLSIINEVIGHVGFLAEREVEELKHRIEAAQKNVDDYNEYFKEVPVDYNHYRYEVGFYTGMIRAYESLLPEGADTEEEKGF